MKLTNPELLSRLAAEYVLGTMKGGARRRLEEYARDNRALRDEIANWEARFTPLANHITPVTPPARVWQKIEARTTNIKTQASTVVSKQNALKTPVNNGLFASLAFWRNLGLGTSALAAALMVSLFTGYLAPARDPMLTAVLEEKGEARMVVAQPNANIITVSMIKPWKPAADKSLQLWVLDKNGEPRSIGIINQDGNTKIAMADMESMLSDGAIFALSKEPMGGSPTGKPTGMILCKGVIAKMPGKKKQGQI